MANIAIFISLLYHVLLIKEEKVEVSEEVYKLLILVYIIFIASLYKIVRIGCINLF